MTAVPIPIGIHDLSLATTHHVLDLAALAEHGGVAPAKYQRGLGQDEMSVPAPDEDTVTLGVRAALPVLERHGTEGIRTLLFATESGVDHSKSAAVFAHRLLDLPAGVRAVELKQACYGATAALQAAAGIVARRPQERVLVIASDIARYELDGPAAATQGAAAVAMLVTADPALLELEPVTGLHSEDVDDFWRPNDSSTAIVDGALSLDAYLGALVGSWDDFQAQGGAPFSRIDRILYHQPFTKMAVKGHTRLGEHTGNEVSREDLECSFRYNRRLGNSYTASLFVALAALLDHDDDLAGTRLGLFSYGSGSVGEFFTGIVRPGYQDHRRREQAAAAMDSRVPVTVEEYRQLHREAVSDSADIELPRRTTGPARLAGVHGHARRYETVQPEQR